MDTYEKKFMDFLDKMRGLLDNAKKQGHIIVRVEDIENAFPELKESEDERIRKDIIALLHFGLADGSAVAPGRKTTREQAIAWLEKQGEDKSIDMSIKEKAHQIAWKMSKYYDPLLSKESWCEMAALDMASWLKRQGDQKFTRSEEDGHWCQKALDFIEHPDLIRATPTLAKNTINWLKSLKQRMEEQQ